MNDISQDDDTIESLKRAATHLFENIPLDEFEKRLIILSQQGIITSYQRGCIQVEYLKTRKQEPMT